MGKISFKDNISAFMEAIQNFEWRSVSKIASPQAAEDLNVFLEKIPQNAGQTMLVIAGVTWAAAAVIGLFATVQIQSLTELRIELQEAQALQPIVPKIQNKAANSKQVSEFIDQITDVYVGLNLRASGSSISISAKTTGAFGQFREAMGHIQNGGAGWSVSIDRLCVGRECDKNPLAASLKINTVSVSKPG